MLRLVFGLTVNDHYIRKSYEFSCQNDAIVPLKVNVLGLPTMLRVSAVDDYFCVAICSCSSKGRHELRITLSLSFCHFIDNISAALLCCCAVALAYEKLTLKFGN